MYKLPAQFTKAGVWSAKTNKKVCLGLELQESEFHHPFEDSVGMKAVLVRTVGLSTMDGFRLGRNLQTRGAPKLAGGVGIQIPLEEIPNVVKALTEFYEKEKLKT